MKISAFIPVTNAIKRGDTFLEAILSHLYWADELIVVDGRSTDGTIEAITALNNPAIKIVTRLWPQEGWSWSEFAKAWNVGLQTASGDWVAAGESDHVFHQDEAKRVREELERESRRGKAIVKIEKLQSADYLHWQSKSQMYYFVYKSAFPQICYGFDPESRTDLAHPIWWDGKTMFDDIPQGRAILEDSPYAGLIGGTGAKLFNYLWTFKTVDQIVQERIKASAGWNRFRGFTEIYKKTKDINVDSVRNEVIQQILSVREKATRSIPLEQQPEIMHSRLLGRWLTKEMVGHPEWQPTEISVP